MQEKSDTKLRAITGRLGCQTQRFRRLVACWVFNPTYLLCPFFLHSTIVRQGETTKLGYFFGLILNIQTTQTGRLKTFQTACVRCIMAHNTKGATKKPNATANTIASTPGSKNEWLNTKRPMRVLPVSSICTAPSSVG